MNEISPQTKFRQNCPEISQHYGSQVCSAWRNSWSKFTGLFAEFKRTNFGLQSKCILTSGRKFARCYFGISGRPKSKVFQAVLHTTARGKETLREWYLPAQRGWKFSVRKIHCYRPRVTFWWARFCIVYYFVLTTVWAAKRYNWTVTCSWNCILQNTNNVQYDRVISRKKQLFFILFFYIIGQLRQVLRLAKFYHQPETYYCVNEEHPENAKVRSVNQMNT